MSISFKENQMRERRRLEEIKKTQRKRELKEKIVFVFCICGIMFLLYVALFNIEKNAQKKCESAGHEITFCKTGLN